ncbi:MAG: hypothetical protein K2Y21_03505 [Phycisphaerales bacterium]|nr:hypothetical protein [Phycisphaerales bacterium]
MSKRAVNSVKNRQLAEAAGRAFTLSEMLVAVAAVAVISVGLAAVFQTVGRTVSTGKRLSALTQQAAILEAQLREDISKMTRDGILMMRHQFTNTHAGSSNGRPSVLRAKRFVGDTDPRARRVDELMFFANGEFRTAREALIPGRNATGRSARIYYGHGLRAYPESTTSAASNTAVDMSYREPEFFNGFNFDRTNPVLRPFNTLLGESDPNFPRLPKAPNEYASEWTLLRHATLLVTPATSSGGGWTEGAPAPAYPSDLYAGTPALVARATTDSTFQVAGQPAAPSIFRFINEIVYFGISPQASQRNFAFYWDIAKQPLANNFTVPRFVSGVVDIATTDLTEIRQFINGSIRDPKVVGGTAIAFYNANTRKLSTLEGLIPRVGGPWLTDSTEAALGYTGVQPAIAPGTKTFRSSLPIMQAWMVGAFPSYAGPTPTSEALENVSALAGGGWNFLGARIRYEDDLPDLRGVMDDPLYAGRAVSSRRANMMAIGSNKIASRCSEFVVEWSFGQTYPDNTEIFDPTDSSKKINVSRQVIWYGGTLNPKSDTPGVFHYNPQNEDTTNIQNSANGVPLVPKYEPYKGVQGLTSKVQAYSPSTWLIHGANKRWPDNPNEKSSLLSYFGYIDPMFVPDNNGEPAMPWPWPKMIRVTFTLADAVDPTLEQTFQYVFDLPPEPKP